ncbi:MAG: hypothetical protein HY541_08155 [Deltaproteobacteria bacterium]|nr:hypothetical protein [Deltaproteobacteria bacterium]
MDLSTLNRVDAEQASRLADKTDTDHRLVFDGSSTIKTVVHKPGDLLKSPFTQTPCVYYKVEVLHEGKEADDFIGTTESEEPFYALIKNHLVQSAIVHADFEPTFKKTYQPGEEPELIRHALEQLGFWEEASSYADYTVTEKVLLPEHPYKLTVEKLGYAIPPQKPKGEPIYGYGYHFHFK